MRLKPVLAAVAALVVLALIIRQVTQAVHRTFGGRPGIARLARATPTYQNGLTLMEIVNVSPQHQYSFSDKGSEDNGGSSPSSEADTGLWVKLPQSVQIPMGCSGEDYSPCRNQITATARASDGHVIPLRWHTSASRSSDGPTYILASIPAGYPSAVRWADVTLNDHHGDSATWRILDLPPMLHVLATPVTPQAMFHQANISVTASAYRGTQSSYNHTNPMILFDLHGTITGASNHWEAGHFTETDEWEPPRFAPQDAGYTLGINNTANIDGSIKLELTRLQAAGDRPEPYIADDHWVRLGAQIQEFETHDETVAFHNVSVVTASNGGFYIAALGPQTVTTPSGISLTLVDVQHQQRLSHDWGGSGFSLLIHYPQGIKYPSLPRSPLWRRHKGIISVSVEVPKPYDSYGSSTYDSSAGGQEAIYSFHANKPLPKTFASFPVIIRQRVDLRAVPMTFTLPVLDKEPT